MFIVLLFVCFHFSQRVGRDALGQRIGVALPAQAGDYKSHIDRGFMDDAILARFAVEAQVGEQWVNQHWPQHPWPSGWSTQEKPVTGWGQGPSWWEPQIPASTRGIDYYDASGRWVTILIQQTSRKDWVVWIECME